MDEISLLWGFLSSLNKKFHNSIDAKKKEKNVKPVVTEQFFLYNVKINRSTFN